MARDKRANMGFDKWAKMSACDIWAKLACDKWGGGMACDKCAKNGL